MESYIDLETLDESLKGIEREGLSDEDICALKLLSTAVALKSEGKPYSEVGMRENLF